MFFMHLIQNINNCFAYYCIAYVKMVLSHEQEEQLIELVNENTHLWNPKDINYKNKQKRQTKFEEIGQRIGGISGL